MDSVAAVAILAVVFLWGAFSGRLTRADLTAPILFAAVGLVLSEGLNLVPEVQAEGIRVLAEVTLVWVLFSDAARVPYRAFGADLGIYLRLLGIGLPLTVGLGLLVALWLFAGTDPWLALLIGAALAPTDAALGSSVMTNPNVPGRVRRMINVESGLNDGIATPVVTIAIGGAAAAEGVIGVPSIGTAFVELLIGLLGGAAVGLCGGWLMRIGRQRGWIMEDFAGPAVLALALLAYTGSLALHGNGFVAAFVGGLVFGNSAGRGSREEVFYVEQTGGLASLLVWLLFGAAAVPIVIDRFVWQVAAYAVLSLSVIRMLPVGLALLGTHLRRTTVAFVGWFGPRGLASLIFALLAVEELGRGADQAVAVIGATVLLSVIMHGLSAAPLATRYGRRIAARPMVEEARVAVDLPVRGLTRGPSDRGGD